MKHARFSPWVSLGSLAVLLAFAACGDGETQSANNANAGGTGGTAACDPTQVSPPTGPYGVDVEDTLADISLSKLNADGTESPTTLYSYFQPCGSASMRLLVIRVEAPWCGLCRVSAGHVDEALSPFEGHGVQVLSVLYSGRDNAAPTLSDSLQWRSDFPKIPGDLTRGVDHGARDLLSLLHAAPSVFIVDPSTMTVLSAIDSPTSHALRAEIAEKLQRVGGDKVDVDATPEAVFDNRFDPERWELIQTFAPPTSVPPDPTNAFADNPAAAALGQTLFGDPSLAGPTNVSCSTCHDPTKGFTDQKPVSTGVGTGTLSAPSITMAKYDRWMFWDGRADSLWAQAIGPIENPIEMGGTRLDVVHRIATTYRTSYESIFGALPDGVDDPQLFPASGKPGDAEYDALPSDRRDAIDRIYVNVGKAIAAYERTIPTPTSRLDDYVAGNLDALTAQERDGLLQFFIGGCATCHWGLSFSDHAFHNVLMPSTEGAPIARGRIDGLPKVVASPFNASGPFSDDPTARPDETGLTPSSDLLGQMKTPTLRGLIDTAPYGHAGTFADFDKLIEHYTFVDPPKVDPAVSGERDIALRKFHSKDADRAAFIAFLKAVGGAPAE
ncbi:MAG: cytochrome c peroxidase [Polyangiaceae bacterium]